MGSIYIVYVRFESYDTFDVFPNAWVLTDAGYFTNYESALCAAEKYISGMDTDDDVLSMKDANGNRGYSALRYTSKDPYMNGRYEAVVIKLEKGT